jgi:diguanylate cyclase (GGDEF)-like protein
MFQTPEMIMDLLMDIFADFLRVFLLTLLGLSGIVGLLAVISPKTFGVVCSYGGRSVSPGGPKRVHRWIDIDQFVIDNARLFGVFIIAAEGLIWFISNHGPESYSKSFLLVTFCLAMLAGVMALGHVLRQKREIESRLAEAHTDVLTGVANRRSFDLELSRRLAQRQRQGIPLCLMIIDIDKFKSFNDDFGHLLGDTILKEVANALVASARHMDIVARLGGDEFAVLLPGSSLDEASQAAERFRTAINDDRFRDNLGGHSPTMSSGVAEAQLDDDAVSLIKRADSALYAAKEAGRDCCFRHGGPELAAPDLTGSDVTAIWPADIPSHEMS